MTDMDFTELQPLRLSKGSHQRGSGRGCAMNVISWEAGELKISDFPECADTMLARTVQVVNDSLCVHRQPEEMLTELCPECSVQVLRLAHRTPGTALPDMTLEELARKHRVRVLTAADAMVYVASDPAWVGEASVIHYVRSVAYAWAADRLSPRDVAVMRRQLDGPRIFNAASAGASGMALGLVNMMLGSQFRAADGPQAIVIETCMAEMPVSRRVPVAVDTSTAEDGFITAEYQVLVDRSPRLRLAHHIIDRFEVHSGVSAPAPDLTRTAAAVREMTTARV